MGVPDPEACAGDPEQGLVVLSEPWHLGGGNSYLRALCKASEMTFVSYMVPPG